MKIKRLPLTALLAALAVPGAAHVTVTVEMHAANGTQYTVTVPEGDPPKQGTIGASEEATVRIFSLRDAPQTCRTDVTFVDSGGTTRTCPPVFVPLTDLDKGDTDHENMGTAAVYRPAHSSADCHPVFTLSASGSCSSTCAGGAPPPPTPGPGPGPGSPTTFSPRAYPNPLKPGDGSSSFTFAGLPADKTLRIYTLNGELVASLRSDGGGGASWKAVDKTGRAVTSGIYLAVSGSVRLKLIVER